MEVVMSYAEKFTTAVEAAGQLPIDFCTFLCEIGWAREAPLAWVYVREDEAVNGGGWHISVFWKPGPSNPAKLAEPICYCADLEDAILFAEGVLAAVRELGDRPH